MLWLLLTRRACRRWLNTHCHLADPRLSADVDAAIERAAAAGVRVIISVGAIGSIQTDHRDTVSIAERRHTMFTP